MRGRSEAKGNKSAEGVCMSCVCVHALFNSCTVTDFHKAQIFGMVWEGMRDSSGRALPNHSGFLFILLRGLRSAPLGWTISSRPVA